MSCLRTDDIQMYLDGELSTSRQLAAESHFAQCNDCRRLLEKQQHDIKVLMDDLDAILPLENQEISPFKAPSISKHRKLSRWWWTAAVIFPLAFGIVFSWNQPDDEQQLLMQQVALDMLYESDLNAQWQSGEIQVVELEYH